MKTLPMSDEARAALIALVQVHGFAVVLKELAEEGERRLKAEPDDSAARAPLAYITTGLQMAAGDAKEHAL